jgi:hypothetical protein
MNKTELDHALSQLEKYFSGEHSHIEKQDAIDEFLQVKHEFTPPPQRPDKRTEGERLVDRHQKERAQALSILRHLRLAIDSDDSQSGFAACGELREITRRIFRK